tara:strand:- start:269 stop:610 length:342 start_codon:yes stop_codon:yes gene_type:complete
MSEEHKSEFDGEPTPIQRQLAYQCEEIGMTRAFCSKLDATAQKKPLKIKIDLEGLSQVTSVISDMKAALEFYATPESYQSISRGFSAQYDPQPSAVKLDKGAMARNILEKHFK